ncbi:hypothetical protein H4R19_001714 [Coemansia spiralis]|nr:hypothetical protein H4R19_001714 [Coemansia spiralis]
MRYRFIVFRAQPREGALEFSIYAEETAGASEAYRTAATLPCASPSDDYALAAQFTTPLPVPGTHAAQTAGAHAVAATTTNEGDQPYSQASRTVRRSWGQCEWLHQNIAAGLGRQVLPPFPERLSASHSANMLAIERTRVRIERWLNRLGARDELCQSAAMHRFLSATMPDCDAAIVARQTLTSKLLGFFGAGPVPVAGGFSVHTPISDIDDFDEDEAERRREYIASTEECAQRLAAAMTAMHAQDKAVAKCVVGVALAVACACHPNAPSPSTGAAHDSYTPGGSGGDRRRLAVSLALLQSSAEAHHWNAKELVTWREFNMVDVVAEYYAMVGGIKGAINHGTEALVHYERSMLRHQTLVLRANTLRIQYPCDTPSVKRANEQEAQAECEMVRAHQEYTDASDLVRRELVRFVRERATGMRKALEEMASVELDAARAQCEELRTICRRIRNIQLTRDPPHARTNIGPLLWQSTDSPAHLHPRPWPGPSPAARGSTGLETPVVATGRPSHRYSASAGCSSVATLARGTARAAGDPTTSHDRAHTIRRVSTMDDADLHCRGRSKAQASGSSSSIRSSAQSSSSGHKPRWNGRITGLPTPVDSGLLAELAADAEAEAELVCSGILATRAVVHKRSASSCHVTTDLVSPGGPCDPLVLPAFRHHLPGASAGRLRNASSFTGLSTIPQPVSPSEYLQYSRLTLHSSLAQPMSSSSLSSGHPGAKILPPHTVRRGRDTKGKQPAFTA